MKPKILTTLSTYSVDQLTADLVAGLTVSLVAIPLSIAIAIASGADPAKGLITAIVGGLLISLFGGSRVQIGGPTGAFIVVVFGVIAQHGYDGLVLATLMAGVILVIAGFLKVGNLITFIPEAVVHGFTIGIAMIIAASQLKDFAGLTANATSADFFGKLQQLWVARGTTNLSALVVAIATLALIILFRRLAPKLPGSIVAVGITSAVVGILGLPVDTIYSRFGALPVGLPMPHLPTGMTGVRLLELLPSAFVIAFLAGVESLLSAMVADRMIASSHRPNAEILSQGIANIGSALFGGLPATGAIARTATNVRAGAKTPVAGVIHALAILVIMMTLGRLAGFLAMPALAALLMLTAFNMSEPWNWHRYLAAPVDDRFLLLMTMTLTVVANLSVAIGSGVAAGLAVRWWKNGRSPSDWTPPER